MVRAPRTLVLVALLALGAPPAGAHVAGHVLRGAEVNLSLGLIRVDVIEGDSGLMTIDPLDANPGIVIHLDCMDFVVDGPLPSLTHTFHGSGLDGSGRRWYATIHDEGDDGEDSSALTTTPGSTGCNAPAQTAGRLLAQYVIAG